MTTARQDVVAHLRAKLPPEIKVLDSIDRIANAKRAVVMVTRESISPVEQYKTRDDGLVVWVLSPKRDIAQAEDDLDLNLDAVLAALDTHRFLHWQTGQRGMYDDQWHAFRVDVPHRTITDEE